MQVQIKWIGDPVEEDSSKTYYAEAEINDSRVSYSSQAFAFCYYLLGWAGENFLRILMMTSARKMLLAALSSHKTFKIFSTIS